jgi:hypothetical protein
MLAWLTLLLIGTQASDRELVEQAAAHVVRRYTGLSGNILFDPRVPKHPGLGARRLDAQSRLLARLADATLAHWDVQYRCDIPAPPPFCVLRDSLPMFLLTEPKIFGDSASITIETITPMPRGRTATAALDVELVLRKRDGRWVVVGTGQYRVTLDGRSEGPLIAV